MVGYGLTNYIRGPEVKPPSRMTSFDKDQAKSKLEATTGAAVTRSLEHFFGITALHGDFVEYDMDGGMKATTTAAYQPVVGESYSQVYTTVDNMHSEMVAVQDMLDRGYWKLEDGRVWRIDGAALLHEEFSTTEPHCGHCTIALSVLGLPFASPSRGRYNLAGNCDYPLPRQVANDPMTLTRYRHSGQCGWKLFKEDLDHMVTTRAGWALQVADNYFVDADGEVVEEFQRPVPVFSVDDWRDHWMKDLMWRQVWECLLPLLDRRQRR